MFRTIRDEVMKAVDEGLIDKDVLLLACLEYMSVDDVKGMLHANEINLPKDSDEEWDEGYSTWRAENRNALKHEFGDDPDFFDEEE